MLVQLRHTWLMMLAVLLVATLWATLMIALGAFLTGLAGVSAYHSTIISCFMGGAGFWHVMLTGWERAREYAAARRDADWAHRNGERRRLVRHFGR